MSTTVFISYSHDSTEHAERVLALADTLREQGLDVRLDQYVAHPAEGWPQWMQRQLIECDYTVLVCTPTYRRRFDRQEQPGVGRGVGWEGLLAEQMLYEAGARNDKLLPVLLEGGTEQDIPLPLRPFSRYHLPDEYEALYRRLTAQPRVVPPPLGNVRPMPPVSTPRSPSEPAPTDDGPNGPRRPESE